MRLQYTAVSTPGSDGDNNDLCEPNRSKKIVRILTVMVYDVTVSSDKWKSWLDLPLSNNWALWGKIKTSPVFSLILLNSGSLNFEKKSKKNNSNNGKNRGGNYSNYVR